MVLRLIAVALLLVDGSNAKHLRGVNRHDPNQELLPTRKLKMSKSKATGGSGEDPDVGIRDDPVASLPLPTVPVTTKAPAVAGGHDLPTTGACLCDAICIACHKQGNPLPGCDIACKYVGKPNCHALCNAYLETGEPADGDDETTPAPPTTKAPTTGNREDPVTEPSLPPEATTTGAPKTGPCLCNSICFACNKHGLQTNDCNIACSFVGTPDCHESCSAFLQTGGSGGDNRDDSDVLPALPPQPPTCDCVALCQGCEDRKSKTRDCKTVCEIAKQDTSTCITNCNAVLHIGEP